MGARADRSDDGAHVAQQMDHPTPRSSHHPGPPRFLQVGDRIADPIFVDGDHGFGRDNLAPTVAGTPERDPDPYPADAFAWSLAECPSGSDASLGYGLPDGDATRYDHGLAHAVEFEPDRPGRYVLELDAPDDTHELTLHVFPRPPDVDDGDDVADGAAGFDGVATAGTTIDADGAATAGAPTDADGATTAGASAPGDAGNPGGPPRLELDATYDEATDAFVVESALELAPGGAAGSEPTVEFLPHDAGPLDPADVTVEGTTARVPTTALDGPATLYAAPFDGHRVGATDRVVLDPDAGTVSYPTRPPAWLDDAVIYEAFTRSFAGAPGATDFDALTERVDYLADLGIDVVWLTPILPAWSPTVEAPPGGPHGYSAADYFDVAPDLGTLADFDRFVDACHERGLRVCFDLAINHCGWTHPYFQDTIAELGPAPEDDYAFPAVEAWDEASPYFDWFDRQRGASDHDAAPAATGFFGVRLQPNLNYGNLALREHTLAAVEFWAERVDMFRCDIAWGVPHSFWAEVRERVRAADAEFVLFDETIPKDPAFCAEFDLHVDTDGFTETVQAVSRGDERPDALLDTVESRRREGFPAWTRLCNAIENHDEPRLYHEAKAHGDRPDPAAAQRAAVAAGMTLPGVPLVYYGGERLITEHGQRRPRPYPGDDDRTDDIERDPYKRAFVNWETTPEDHLAFYRDLIACYHESPVLGPAADLVRVAHRTGAPEDLVAFGRDAGAEKRVIVVNFAAGPRTVDLPPAVAGTDRVTGTDVVRRRSEDAVTVAVDTLAVLETPTLPCGGSDDSPRERDT